MSTDPVSPHTPPRAPAEADESAKKFLLSVVVSGEGRVVSKPAGIKCGRDCEESFAPGTKVKLTAKYDGGSRFSGWGGACSGSGTTCRVKMTKARSVTAEFTQVLHAMSVDVDGAGRVTSDPVGIDCGETCFATFPDGTVVTLTAEPSLGWDLPVWGGECAGAVGPTCTITMHGRTSVSAQFVQLSYPLDVTIAGNGTGSVSSDPAGIACPGDCTEAYLSGTVVTLTASKGAGSGLAWSGACSGSAPTCTVTMDAAKIVTATFTLTTHVLTVTRSGNGSVTSNPAGISCPADCTQTYNYGTVVTLTQKADTGWVFTGWSGSCSGTGTCQVTMTAAKTVTATFTPNQYTLSLPCCYGDSGGVSSSPGGIDCGFGAEDCAQAYTAGTEVVLTAQSFIPFRFYGWSGDCSGGGGQRNTCTLVIDSNKSVDAIFDCHWKYPDCWSAPRDATEPDARQAAVDSSEPTVAASWLPAADRTRAAFASGNPIFMSRLHWLTGKSSPQDEWELSVLPSGRGRLTSEPVGIRCGGICKASFESGTKVTLTEEPAAGWRFVTWGGACSGTSPTCSVKMKKARSVTAEFGQIMDALSVNTIGSGTLVSDPAGIDCGDDCFETFPDRSKVRLTAEPGAGWEFTSWGGECAGTHPPTCRIEMRGRTVASAEFTQLSYPLSVKIEGTGAGAVSSDPAGIACPDDCDDNYLSGTDVVLTAAPGAGSALTWSGACTGNALTCDVRMDAAKGATATFTRQSADLSVSVGNPGGPVTSQPSGISCPAACRATFTFGASVALDPNSSDTYHFLGWRGHCTGLDLCTVVMDGPKTVSARYSGPWCGEFLCRMGDGRDAAHLTAIANIARVDEADRDGRLPFAALSHSPAFSSSIARADTARNSELFPAAKKFRLSVERSGDGRVVSKPAGIKCGHDCSQSYAPATKVKLTAEHDEGSRFSGWGGACSGSGLTCTVKMKKARSVTADFTQALHALSVVVDGSGRVTSEPAGIDCGETCFATFSDGTVVTLTAEPSLGWDLPVWGGECTGAVGPTCTITMHGRTSASAEFIQFSYPLDVTIAGNGTGSVSSSPAGIACPGDCTESYLSGTVVTLTASKGAGSGSAWSGACSGSAPTCTVTMDAAKIVTATFTLTTHVLTVTRSGNGTVTSSPAGISCPADCTQTYTYGTEVTLTQKADTGWVFTGWSGSCSGTGTCQVTMTVAKTVNATFTQQATKYTLTVRVGGIAQAGEIRGPGIYCTYEGGGNDCSETYSSGTEVTLSALAFGPRYVFDGWGGACADFEFNPICEITISKNQDVTANFVCDPQECQSPISQSGGATSMRGGASARCSFVQRSDYVQLPLDHVSVCASPAAQYFDAEIAAAIGAPVRPPLALDRRDESDKRFELSVVVSGEGRVVSRPAGIKCGRDCEGSFASGSKVKLTASYDGGWRFSGWGGACSGSDTTCRVKMTKARSVTADFTQVLDALSVAVDGSGRVRSTPAGIDCGESCFATFPDGTVVTLTAEPSLGWDLPVWGGECAGAVGASCTMTMHGRTSVSAEFVQLSYPLDVTIAGNGTGSVSSDPAGIACPGDCTESFPSGTAVTLTAGPGAGSGVAWSGACSGGSLTCNLTMDAAKSVTATFTLTTHVLTVTRSGNGSVTSSPAGISCPADCTGTYVYGTVVTLIQKADTGWVFTGWNGSCSGTGTCQVTMTSAKTVTATFTPNRHTLTVSVDDQSFGNKVKSEPAGIDCPTECSAVYDNETSVQLTAFVGARYRFEGWRGDCSGRGSCVVLMNADRFVESMVSGPWCGEFLCREAQSGLIGTNTYGSESDFNALLHSSRHIPRRPHGTPRVASVSTSALGG